MCFSQVKSLPFIMCAAKTWLLSVAKERRGKSVIDTLWLIMKAMTCPKSALLLPHELPLAANNHSAEAGGGLCSPLFDLVQIVFSVRLVGVQVLRLPLRLQAACYCFPTDKVWEPAAMCHRHFSANVWKLPDLLIEVIQSWLDTESRGLFFHI